VRVLGQLGDNACQRTLADLASEGGIPQELRIAAVESLREAIALRGLLLTHDELVTQYRRFDAGKTTDQDNQAILGRIQSVIEAPTRKGTP
jgi:hypothetical protein